MNPWAKKNETLTAVRSAVAENLDADILIEGPSPEVILPEDDMLESSPDDSIGDTDERITGHSKLSKLIDDDFPFDESQLDAIDGLSQEPYGCLTGAAGTGKTTTTKKLVDKLLETSDLASVNMESYWKSGFKPEGDDDYEATQKWVPSVAMCAFTGRATQMVKKNFPRDWHGNIMTIHRMLGYAPEFYEEWDDENGGYRKKMRFIPTYNADFLMPWDIVIIDEAGMLGIDLWHELLAACKPGCRIYMIGDINQLPPVHGRSVFGYAMCNWPSWELTHVHRQQGENNPIVDNAWRILNGRMPQSEGRFQMIPLKGDAAMASRKMRALAPKLQEMGIYDPIRDSIITPINGEEGSRGFQLGQLPLNREFALIFNPKSEHPRFIIDGGRERKQFAVGDKVMATKNDWEAGITNGMTGVITEIEPNAEYAGDNRLFGTVESVNEYLSENPDEAILADFTLDDLNDSMVAIDAGKEKGKEKRDRGPSSHLVTVRFGTDDHGFEVPFASLSEVGSLMIAYVVTCHKMQGGEAPVILIICHDAHRSMLYREWLYTAVTRASEKCILIYSETALKTALSKQKMPGSTLKQKVLAFNALQESGSFSGKNVIMPHSASTRNRILDREDTEIVTPSRLTTEAEKKGGLMSLINKQRTEQPAPKPAPARPIHLHVHIHETPKAPAAPTPKPAPIDGGDLTPQQILKAKLGRNPTQQESMEAAVYGIDKIGTKPSLAALPAPVELVSQWGAAQVGVAIAEVMEWSRFLLPAPAPVEPPKKMNPWARKLGQ